MNNISLKYRAVELLKSLISTPSITRNEDNVAQLLFDYLLSRGFSPERYLNNIIIYNKHFSPDKESVVLCSHHDTVVANTGYTLDPFTPIEQDGKLYGLGSNDAGASLVALVSVFEHFYNCQNMKYNICLLLTAEEESSGVNGMGVMYDRISKPHLVVVGEPTSMDVAIAERGLMVLDCEVEGVAGHAAHNNTVNPIIKAINDIQWFSTHRFADISPVLGEVKMSVTVISAGSQHNTVPASCSFTVDVRSNGCYSNREIFDIVSQSVSCKVVARSFRLNPSSIDSSHRFVECCVKHGSKLFGSSTLSDQALVGCESVKIGVGDTLRSHTADEFVYIDQIHEGIERYIDIFTDYLIVLSDKK